MCPGLEAQFPARRREERGCRPVTGKDRASCLYAAHQAAELSSKTQSQPLLVGFKASTQPCQHIGALPRAKPEDRLTQLSSHSYMQGKATLGLHQGVSETQNMLVPLLASAGHTTCNAEPWGDSRAICE